MKDSLKKWIVFVDYSSAHTILSMTFCSSINFLKNYQLGRLWTRGHFGALRANGKFSEQCYGCRFRQEQCNRVEKSWTSEYRCLLLHDNVHHPWCSCHSCNHTRSVFWVSSPSVVLTRPHPIIFTSLNSSKKIWGSGGKVKVKRAVQAVKSCIHC